MHEISLVRSIFRSLEETLTAEEMSQLSGIDLTVGKLSNVEPILMQNAFEAVLASEQTRFAHVKLNIEVLPILARCTQCGTTKQVEDYRFVCDCGGAATDILQGNELLISKVHLDSQDVGYKT